MKVSKLIELLNTENQDAEVFAYLGAEQGWKIQQLGYGDAVIGSSRTDKESFVLIPVEVPTKFEPWSDDGRITSEDDLATWTEESSLDGTLCRNGYPIDECKCC